MWTKQAPLSVTKTSLCIYQLFIDLFLLLFSFLCFGIICQSRISFIVNILLFYRDRRHYNIRDLHCSGNVDLGSTQKGRLPGQRAVPTNASQTPPHFRSSETQATCDGCLAQCQLPQTVPRFHQSSNRVDCT